MVVTAIFAELAGAGEHPDFTNLNVLLGPLRVGFKWGMCVIALPPFLVTNALQIVQANRLILPLFGLTAVATLLVGVVSSEGMSETSSRMG